jgi:4-amino-4-deoxy-L-arabinose transferase-like glycosyltransferase
MIRSVRVGPIRGKRILVGVLVGLFLAEMAFAMVSTAVAQTPTVDEPVYVATGTVYVQQHRLRYNFEHPPLGKLIIAAGVVFAHPHLDPAFTGSPEELGRHFLYESGNNPDRLMLLARIPMIVLTLLFGLVVFAFARDLAGTAGGVVALALYAFLPDVIANGSLATLDVPTAGFLLTAVWLSWRARDRPRLYLPLAGLALGAAVATKMSALAAVPGLLLLAFLAGRRWTERLVYPLGVALIGLAVVWLSYLAVDPSLHWTTPADLPPVHGMRALVVDALPLPRPFRDGLRMQFAFEDTVWGGFLFGHAYYGSHWYYLPAALLVKSPLGALVLWLAGAAVVLALKRLRPAAPYLLLTPAVLLAVGLDESRNLGVRYAIVVPVFLTVASAGVVLLRRRWARVVAVVLVTFVAISSLRTYPYYLPYSNEAFGGPSKTYLSLHDSNVDWGQDLGRLADRLHEKYPGQRVWLVFKGGGLPSYYGIDAASPLTVPESEVHGLLVVSNTERDRADAQLAALIGSSRRLEDVGHSITIYRR